MSTTAFAVVSGAAWAMPAVPNADRAVPRTMAATYGRLPGRRGGALEVPMFPMFEKDPPERPVHYTTADEPLLVSESGKKRLSPRISPRVKPSRSPQVIGTQSAEVKEGRLHSWRFPQGKGL